MALPSTKDLFYFYTVAKELHFSHAAKKLHVSQPSLSIAIKRLENLFGTNLFIRHNHGVTLTQAGEKLCDNVKKIFLLWEETVTVIKDTKQCIKGTIRIGCHSTITPFMSGMVSQLLKQYPELQIHFHHDISMRVMENILKGQCDIGLVTDPHPHPDIIQHSIGLTEMGFWVAKEHQTKFDLLAKETIFICNPEIPQTQYLIKQLLKLTKHTELKQNIINTLEAMVLMTIQGYGIGILPSNYTYKYFSDKLVLLSDAPTYKKPLCLVYRPENKNMSAVRTVITAIRGLARRESEPK